MKIKNVVIVALLFFGLMAYIISFELPKNEKRTMERKPLHGVGKGQIASLEIVKPNQRLVLINSVPKQAIKKGAQNEDRLREMDAVFPEEWSIESIPSSRVDSSNLNAIISQLVALELGEALPDSELDADLALYGLLTPELILALERLDEYSARKKLIFEFGKKSDYLGKRYLRYTRIDGSKNIFLIDDLLYFALNKAPKEFRKKDPVSFVDKDIKKIELSGDSQTETLIIERNGNKVPGAVGVEPWKLVAPIQASADQSKISEVLRNLKALRVKNFFDGEDAKIKGELFEKPFLKIVLTGKADPLEIRVSQGFVDGKQQTFFSVSGSPSIFEAESNVVSEVRVASEAYRKTKFFDIDANSVVSFDLSGSGVPALKGNQNDQGWKLADKIGDEPFLRQWFLDLSEISAQSFPTESSNFGFETPLIRFGVTLKDPLLEATAPSIERVLVVGAEHSSEGADSKTYFAAVDELAEPFIISSETLRKIIPKVETLVLVPEPTPETPREPAAANSEAMPQSQATPQ